MSAYATIVFITALVVAGLTYVIANEIVSSYLIPLSLQFTTDPTTLSWLNNFFSAILPLAIVFTDMLWYLTQVQMRKAQGGLV